MPRRASIPFILIALLSTTLFGIVQAEEIGFEKTWDKRIGSVIYGGVHIDESSLYAGAEDGKLRAFAKSDGKLQWVFDAGAAVASGVAADDMRAYFHTRDGAVHAVDKSTGKELWRFATGGERRWDYWDYYLSTPAVDDRQVYFGSGDHHVYALDKRTGQLRWKLKTENIVHGEPLLSGEKVIVGGFDGRLYAIDRGAGRLLWRFKTVGNAYFRNGELPGAATASDGIVYFGGRDYNIYALLEETGTGAWNQRTPSWIVGRPLVVGEDLIVVNSDGAAVFSFDRKSGKENWKTSNSYNMFAGAEALGTGHVAVASLDGRITVLSRADGEKLGVYETGASRKNHDRFFTEDGKTDYTGVKSLDDLMDFYERQITAMDGITGPIAVEDETIYYATAGGEVAAIRVAGIDLPAGK